MAGTGTHRNSRLLHYTGSNTNQENKMSYDTEPKSYSEMEDVFQSRWDADTEKGEAKRENAWESSFNFQLPPAPIERSMKSVDCNHPTHCQFPHCKCL